MHIQVSRLPTEYFDWSTWRAGSIADLMLVCRKPVLCSPHGATTLRQYAVGWCPGARLYCRPKSDCTAVMFYKDDTHFWFHLRNDEFEFIFGGFHD